jgi:S1-C subfamily serine protease
MHVRSRIRSFALVAAVLVVPSIAAAAQQQPARVRTIVRRDSTQTSDSTFVRIALDAVPSQQLMEQLLSLRATEETLVRALREQSLDENRRRDMVRSLTDISRRNTEILSALQVRCRTDDARPDGYLGITYGYTGTVVNTTAGQRVMVQSTDGRSSDAHPTISSVEPGSPAEKAGVRTDDVLLTIGGLDVRKDPSLAALLRVGARVPVVVQREGARKELQVLVTKRPTGYGTSPCIQIEELAGPVVREGFRVSAMAQGASAGTVVRRAPTPPAAPAQPDLPPPPGGQIILFSTTRDAASAVAGATLTPVNDAWRDALVGVDKGLIVTAVARGLPASESGLRAGDCIVSANDQPVTTAAMLMRVIDNNSDARSVKLQIIRKGKPQTLTLSWSDR